MIRNMGRTDRVIRAAVVAPILVVAAFLTGVTTVAGIVLLVAAAVMVATATTAFCPLYRLFGMDTRGRVGTQ